MVRNTWVNCTCDTRATPPRSSPLYQAKNPRYWLKIETYAKPAHSTAVAAAKSPRSVTSTSGGNNSGTLITNAQLMVSRPPSSRVSSAPWA